MPKRKAKAKRPKESSAPKKSEAGEEDDIPPDARFRAWCYTSNNYDEERIARYQKIPCEYHIFGREVGKEGTPHLQGFIYFKYGKTLSSVRKVLPGSHCKPKYKNSFFSEAAGYCRKQDSEPFEKGSLPQDPKVKGDNEATRWERIRDLARAGDVQSVGEEYPDAYIQSYRTLKMIAADHMEKPADLEDVAGEWLYGPSGAGKTTLARDLGECYIKDRTKWWNGYAGQEIVVMDDFDPYCKGMAALVKDWGDKYCFKAETKNGYMFIRPKKFIITSQYLPRDIWEDQATLDAIHSRYHINMVTSCYKKTRKVAPSAFLGMKDVLPIDNYHKKDGPPKAYNLWNNGHEENRLEPIQEMDRLRLQEEAGPSQGLCDNIPPVQTVSHNSQVWVCDDESTWSVCEEIDEASQRPESEE